MSVTLIEPIYGRWSGPIFRDTGCLYSGILEGPDGFGNEVFVEFCQDENGLAGVSAAPPVGAWCGGCAVLGVFCGGFSCETDGGCSYSVCG